MYRINDLVCWQVIVFPISIVIGNILKGYPQNGFADVENACYNNTSPSFTQPSLVCNRPNAVACSEPNRYLYWVCPNFPTDLTVEYERFAYMHTCIHM
jgi:hypothetical protein